MGTRSGSTSSSTTERCRVTREYPVRRPVQSPPVHPGEILREDVLPALRLSVTEAARQLGVARQTLHRIIAGRAAVTPEMAVRLGKFCGNGPGLWLRLQQTYDLWHAERRLSEAVARIPSHRPAA
jgi:addiction module HigA family antidote